MKIRTTVENQRQSAYQSKQGVRLHCVTPLPGSCLPPMEQQEESSSLAGNITPRKQLTANNLCEECREKASKYKCPGCSLLSCGLACVNAHRLRTSCTGKPDRTRFVPISQFDDNLLVSDYNLLEEMKRAAESAQRMRTRLRAYPNYRVPFYLQSLRKAASKRSTRLLLLPSGMSKREKNQSRYDHRKNFITWTIEWRFDSTDVVLLDHGVHEDTILCSMIKKHLNPGPWNHKLRAFCEEQPDSLKCFIHKCPQGPKSPFRQLDMKTPLRQQLANLVILEFPVIHVYLPSHSCSFEIVKDMPPVLHRQETKNSASSECPNSRGVVFMEEEIQDNSSSDPKVFDFTKSRTFGPTHQTPPQEMSEKQLLGSSDAPCVMRAVGGVPYLDLENMESAIMEDSEFDFDQGLIDAYSDLIAQVNPDDFFDFKGDFFNEALVSDNTESVDCQTSFLMGDELEEGEIVE